MKRVFLSLRDFAALFAETQRPKPKYLDHYTMLCERLTTWACKDKGESLPAYRNHSHNRTRHNTKHRPRALSGPCTSQDISRIITQNRSTLLYQKGYSLLQCYSSYSDHYMKKTTSKGCWISYERRERSELTLSTLGPQIALGLILS